MCDTMIVLANLTASGRTTLAKNSDREPNEAQYLTQVPAADHAQGSRISCTYVDIPQVAHTYAVIGSRPWWMWGFEHGVNEKGVAIGNEAVWSRLPASVEPGLLGMDLLRLTLERAATADEAFSVLTSLIETHGQSGNAAANRTMLYHNSFIMADSSGGWVLQTAGKHWVAQKIGGWASISNVYSIGSDYDAISAHAVDFAIAQGWYDPASGEPFDFAKAYADPDLPTLQSCQNRFSLSQTGMGDLAAKGDIKLAEIFDILRSHGPSDEDPDWRPGEDGESHLCMHARSAAGFETAASMVAELPPIGDAAAPIVYWASLASPCLSAFVPVWFDSAIPAAYEQPVAGAPDAWWSQETLQRLIERDYALYAGPARAIYARLEREAISMVAALAEDGGTVERRRITNTLVARQEGARAIIYRAVEDLIAGPLPPRPDDPRGSYLLDIAADRPDTARRHTRVA
ncbi:hypothetical protein LMIY3S_00137 [Labrys miyagiensis]